MFDGGVKLSLQELNAKESNDPKAFWQIIHISKQVNTGNVTIEDLLESFSVLNPTEETNEVELVEDNRTVSEQSTSVTNGDSEILNLSITEMEDKKH